MSSKIEGKTWSLAIRLLIWYSVAVCILSGVAIGTVYISVVVHQDRKTDEWLREAAEFLNVHRAEALTNLDTWICSPTRMVDESGQVVFESPQIQRLFPNGRFPPAGAAGEDRRATDGRVYRLVSVVVEHWTYDFAQDRTAERELLAQLRLNIALAAFPTLAISLAIGYVLARQGLRPIQAMISAARAVSPKYLNGRVPVYGHPAELRELAETLNAVLARMQEAFARLDQFSADVAHELRTPVHNLRGGIEVSLRQTRTPDEYQRTLIAALSETDRLGRLVDRLLLLAQAEDPRREVRPEMTDVIGEFEGIREFFGPAAAEVGISIEVVSQPPAEFPLDRALFQRALSNLVANALAHTPAGGSVRLAAEADELGLCVRVEDTGSGIPAGDIPHLFDRYFRSRAARASGRGVGLGLAIVRRVVELHGGTVNIKSSLGHGTTLRLFFPHPAPQ
jgi:two-component system heavy metal sensor histidine kinase CusS